jgi:hypothetical protein
MMHKDAVKFLAICLGDTGLGSPSACNLCCRAYYVAFYSVRIRHQHRVRLSPLEHLHNSQHMKIWSLSR